MSQGMRMEMDRFMDRRLEQRQVLSPPIANSVEEVVENAKLYSSEESKLDDRVYDLVLGYIEKENSEKPYTDVQLSGLVSEEGYLTTRKDISQVRRKLGIKPSSGRRDNY